MSFTWNLCRSDSAGRILYASTGKSQLAFSLPKSGPPEKWRGSFLRFIFGGYMSEIESKEKTPVPAQTRRPARRPRPAAPKAQPNAPQGRAPAPQPARAAVPAAPQNAPKKSAAPQSAPKQAAAPQNAPKQAEAPANQQQKQRRGYFQQRRPKKPGVPAPAANAPQIHIYPLGGPPPGQHRGDRAGGRARRLAPGLLGRRRPARPAFGHLTPAASGPERAERTPTASLNCPDRRRCPPDLEGHRALSGTVSGRWRPRPPRRSWSGPPSRPAWRGTPDRPCRN